MKLVLENDGKHCGKRRKCWLSAFSPFPTMFSKGFFLRVVKSRDCVVKSFTHYHTMAHFDALKIYSFGKHCKKRRNCFLQAIPPFLTMFSILYGTSFSFQMHFKMSSAICSIWSSLKMCWLHIEPDILILAHLGFLSCQLSIDHGWVCVYCFIVVFCTSACLCVQNLTSKLNISLYLLRFSRYEAYIWYVDSFCGYASRWVRANTIVSAYTLYKHLQ